MERSSLWVANYNFCLKTRYSAGLLQTAFCPTLPRREGPARAAMISTNSGGRNISAGYPNQPSQRD